MSIHEAIITISQFDTPEGKAYWIDKLEVSQGYKGYLLRVFNLN